MWSNFFIAKFIFSTRIRTKVFACDEKTFGKIKVYEGSLFTQREQLRAKPNKNRNVNSGK